MKSISNYSVILKKPIVFVIDVFWFLWSVCIFALLAPLAIVVGQFKDQKSKSCVRRVFVAGVETSNNIRQISDVLSQSRKWEVSVFEFQEHPFYPQMISNDLRYVGTFGKMKAGDSYLLRSLKRHSRLIWLLRAMFRENIVFFNWTQSFLCFNLDYILIKLAGLDLIVRHCGSDVRYRPLQNGVHCSFGVHQWSAGKSRLPEVFFKLAKQSIAERLCKVLSSRDFATFQRKALIHRPYIQQSLPRTTGFSRTKPLILHAPSDPAIKGTKTVLAAIDLLKRIRTDFDFLILTKVPHADVLHALSETLILLDQPGAFPARLATEGFASGCVVVGGNIPEIHGFSECPAIPFPSDAVELFRLLCALLDDKNRSLEISERSVYFWSKYCSPDSFLEFFDKLVDGRPATFVPLQGHVDLLRGSSRHWYEKLAIKLRYG